MQRGRIDIPDIRLDGLNILIVDDAADNRLLVSRFLSLAGAVTRTAEDGAQGIEIALSESFDAILMDIQMPRMDGYEALSRLRVASYDGPIIALTAHAMRSERERCLSSGFDGYMTKPIVRGELILTIKKLCDQRVRPAAEDATPPSDTQPDQALQRAQPAEHQNSNHSQH